jgi:predicted transcriptional regulator
MFFDHQRGSRRPLSLGPTEVRLLEILWRQSAPMTVSELRHELSALAYTTLMTTMDRLHRKGVLERQRRGRAFAYRVHWTRDELLAKMTADEIISLLPRDASRQPVLSLLIDAVARKDVALLDELDALIQTKRKTIRREVPR